jgi:hypothetical protein
VLEEVRGLLVLEPLDDRPVVTRVCILRAQNRWFDEVRRLAPEADRVAPERGG